MPELTRRAFARMSGGCVLLGLAGAPLIGVTPAAARIVDRADLWREAVQNYMWALRHNAGRAQFLAARNAAAQASIAVLDLAAAEPRDVLIKYYVLYECTLFSSFDLDFPERRFDAWCDEVAREAEDFGLTITPFWWTMRSDPNPRINGSKDRSTTDWKEVRPWQIER
jgi:hypothetical protein